jgi:hypothetical protein
MVQWSKADKIRWVENRLAEQTDPKLRVESVPPREDLEVWLSRERDDNTWGKIGLTHFHQKNPDARKSATRRAHERVEKYLQPDPDNEETARLEELQSRQVRRKRIGLHPDYLEEMEMNYLRERIQAKRRRPRSLIRYRTGPSLRHSKRHPQSRRK